MNRSSTARTILARYKTTYEDHFVYELAVLMPKCPERAALLEYCKKIGWGAFGDPKNTAEAWGRRVETFWHKRG